MFVDGLIVVFLKLNSSTSCYYILIYIYINTDTQSSIRLFWPLFRIDDIGFQEDFDLTFAFAARTTLVSGAGWHLAAVGPGDIDFLTVNRRGFGMGFEWFHGTFI